MTHLTDPIPDYPRGDQVSQDLLKRDSDVIGKPGEQTT